MDQNRQKSLQTQVQRLLNSEFETLREYNLAFCKLLDYSDAELREVLLPYENTPLHNQAGFMYEQLNVTRNKGLMPTDFYKPLPKDSLERLHSFSVPPNPYDAHAAMWYLESGFPTRYLKQYLESGVI